MESAISKMTDGIEVRSKFNPTSETLSQFRNLLKVDRNLREIFEGGSGEVLSHVQEKYPELLEAASFVMDEYEQLGRGCFLISSRTGKIIARVTEENVYHPAPMVRESAEGGPQHLVHKNTVHLKPELEAFFTWSMFEEERELDYLSYVRSSGVLAPDLNTDFFTRAGRTSLLHQVESTLWTDPVPFLKKFLSLYPPSSLGEGETVKLTLEVTRPLHDMKSYSVRANHLTSLKAALSYRILDQLAMWFEQRIESGPDLDNWFSFGRAWADVAVTGISQNVYVGPGALSIQDFQVKGMEINGTWYIRGEADLLIRPGVIRGGDLC